MNIKMAFRNLAKNRRRSLVTCGSIALGFLALSLFEGYFFNVYAALEDQAIVGERLGHLTVARSGYFEAGAMDPDKYVITPEELAVIRARFKDDPEVRLVSPRLNVSGLVSNGKTSTIFMGEALDPADMAVLRRAKVRFESLGMGVRTLRATCQPLDAMENILGRPFDVPEVVDLAREVESVLGDDFWFCLPGHAMDRPGADIDRMDCLSEVLRATSNIFTNTLVASREGGINLEAIRRSAQVMLASAETDADGFENFRYCAMGNVAPGTPFFPASWHRGRAGFSIGLELSTIANRCFAADGTFEERLSDFTREVRALESRAAEAAEAVAAETGWAFLGMDMSLAPYPGANTSAVGSIEALAGSPMGTYNFLFALFCVNNMLQSGPSRSKRIGYSGTMLSLLEDTRLGDFNSEEGVRMTDLLLCSTVCGCGIDMVPVNGDVREENLAQLILAVATESVKCDKPLIARLIPTHGNGRGWTSFRHDFIHNTRIVDLGQPLGLPGLRLPNFFGMAAKVAAPEIMA